ncbi:aromatic compound dioxygenase [Ceratobasidium sp. AG-I]|nr:aromatic compound dioxygenase [Ceratobasidium sp. AG-I]
MGRHYIPGAPEIGMEDGKGVLGAMVDMKKSPLFLFWGKVLGPDGEPVHATLDLWQANTSGVYAHATYNNRGILHTSSTSGSFEILTIPPGEYGALNKVRAGHIHAVISAKGYESLVTQFYVCRGNDEKWLGSDILNYIRSPRSQNITKCWAIPTEKGDRYYDLPPLDGSNDEMVQRVEEWNSQLSAMGMRIGCGGEDVIKLNKA